MTSPKTPATPAIIQPSTVQPITNIAQLMEALAVGWVADRPETHRTLIAGNLGGHVQFVRPPPLHSMYPAYRIGPDDIPVESGGYSMAGLIKFEAHSLLTGLLETNIDNENVFHTATLTAAGFDAAQSGLLSFPVSQFDIARCAFLNPRGKLIESDRALEARQV